MIWLAPLKLTWRLQYCHHLTVSSLSGLVKWRFPILISQVRIGSMTQQSLKTHRHIKTKITPMDLHASSMSQNIWQPVCIYSVDPLPWQLAGVQNRQRSVVRMTSDLCWRPPPSRIETPPWTTNVISHKSLWHSNSWHKSWVVEVMMWFMPEKASVSLSS